MIARQENSLAARQRNPARGLGGLAGLVDHNPVELAVAEDDVVNRGGRADHVGAVEHVIDRLPLQLP